MRSGGAVAQVDLRRSGRHRCGRAPGALAIVAIVLLALLAWPPAAAADPAQPVAPQATTSPTPTPEESTTATPTTPTTPTAQPGPRPDPEGDRWVQLAVVAGGSLLGAVFMFMVIGGIIRAVNRRRYRR